MTEIVIYNCKSCGKSYGPLGMRGFSSEKGEANCRYSEEVYFKDLGIGPIGQKFERKCEYKK